MFEYWFEIMIYNGKYTTYTINKKWLQTVRKFYIQNTIFIFQAFRIFSVMIQNCIKIIKNEGPGGLYRGVVPTIAKQATNQAVRFPTQFYFLKFMVGDDKEKQKSPIMNGLAGAVAGGISVLVTMPQDTIKTRMQGEEAKKLYKGTMDCAMQIMKNDGPGFFYAGTWPRMIRVSLDVGITFCVFPLLSKFI